MKLNKFANLRCFMLAACSCLRCFVPSLAAAQTDVLTQHNDTMRTGANLNETILKPANVNGKYFGMLFKHAVDDQLYTQPLVATGIKIGGGWHDVVYVTTVNNSVYAFDAHDAAEPVFWHVNFGVPPTLHDADFGCLDMNGAMGIIGTPVIDPDKKAIYVVAVTKVGKGFVQRLHALDLATGADLPQSPVVISAPDFNPLLQSQRPALTFANGTVYIGYASHCDKEPYHGYLLAYDAASFKQIGLLNTSPGGTGGSIWQSGLAPAVDASGNIYLITGNGSWNGTTQFSESFLKLDRSLNLIDWFTPTNHSELDKHDNDLNSSGALLIPGTHLVAGGGKEGTLYLLDTEKLGHLGDEHAAQKVQATGSHLHSLVYWQSAEKGKLIYLWGQRDRLRAYQFMSSKLDETPLMSRTEMNEGHPGAMLSLSAHGDKDGILWAAIHATGDAWHESRPGILHAYDAGDIHRELWNSLNNAARDNCGNYSKMAPATIANGKVYLASFGKENIGTGQLCVYGLLPAGGPPAEPENVHAVIEGRFIDIEWSAVPGATTYMIDATQAGKSHRVSAGLVRPNFIEPAIDKGTISYTVKAINANGASLPSKAAEVRIEKVPKPRAMVMH